MEEPAAYGEAVKEPEKTELSVVIPVFNEADSLPELYQRLSNTLQVYGRSYELLFVDDGSTDASPEHLRAFSEQDQAVRVVRLLRNFGQQMAITAGFQKARGQVIVLIDADLQTRPEEIPLLVDTLAEGYDIVYGARKDRKDPLLRRWGSWGISRFLHWTTGIDLPDNASGFLAINRTLVDAVNRFPERTRYLGGLLAWLGANRSAAVPVSHEPRRKGESKYRFSHLLGLAFDFVCSFSMVPLRLTWLAGGMVVLSGFLSFWMYRESILPGFLIIVSGIQLFALGILGEYMGRLYREARQRPLYIIREEYGGGGDRGD